MALPSHVAAIACLLCCLAPPACCESLHESARVVFVAGESQVTLSANASDPEALACSGTLRAEDFAVAGLETSLKSALTQLESAISDISALQTEVARLSGEVETLQAERANFTEWTHEGGSFSGRGVTLPLVNGVMGTPHCDITIDGRLMFMRELSTSSQILCYCHDTPSGGGGRIWSNVVTGAHGDADSCPNNVYDR